MPGRWLGVDFVRALPRNLDKTRGRADEDAGRYNERDERHSGGEGEFNGDDGRDGAGHEGAGLVGPE